MKYLLLGAITEAGQRLSPPDLESWMAEIGAWYEKHATTGQLADPGHQLDWPDKAKTIRASGVTDGRTWRPKRSSPGTPCWRW
jgi:hypothetical protein